MRAAIFEALASFDKPASALRHRLRKVFAVAGAADRGQQRLPDPGPVRRSEPGAPVESANAYIANDHPDCLHDCIFLICDNCGQTTHLDDDKLSGGVRAVAKEAGFAPDRPVIEVRGRCGNCEAE
jgi:Fur family zinc uptake transcriptional regulator